MKVKDLIKQLCEMNLEADVVIEIPNEPTNYKYVSTEQIDSVSMISEEKCLIEGR